MKNQCHYDMCLLLLCVKKPIVLSQISDCAFLDCSLLGQLCRIYSREPG